MMEAKRAIRVVCNEPKVMTMKARWGVGERTVVSVDDLSAAMMAIENGGQPTMLFLEEPGGPTLVLGIGLSESVLTFVETDGASFHSRGDVSRKGRLQFWCRDQLDEFMEEMAVPLEVARRAASEFVRTKARPTAVLWEADW